jgi:glycerol-3-phosphate dehydrogenase
LTRDEATLVIRNYGAQSAHVLALLPETAPPGLTRLECAQIAFAVSHEMAQSLADLMFVSTYWGYERKWTRESIMPFAAEMARHLGWDGQRKEQEISHFA